LTRGGAQHFQIILHEGEAVEPWKEAKLQDFAVYVPLAVHF
jgi:hypothetical protein